MGRATFPSTPTRPSQRISAPLDICAIAQTRSDPVSALQPPPFVRPPPMSGGARDQKPTKKLEWDWDLEHQDRAQEAKADAAVHNAQPFLVDRRVLKDVVKENFKIDVARIVFLTSGAPYNSPSLIPRSHLLCRYRRHFPQGISKSQPRHSARRSPPPRLIWLLSSMALNSSRGLPVGACPGSRPNPRWQLWTFCGSTQTSPSRPSITTILVLTTASVESISSCPRYRHRLSRLPCTISKGV